MRCFVAVWPDQATRVALAALSDDLRQRVAHRRATDVDNLHLTLAFIGNLADETAAGVAQAISQLQFEPFEWHIDRLGFFREAGVVWAGSARDSSTQLLALTAHLRGILDELKVEYDNRPLAPHVTLLRGVRSFRGRRLDASIQWRIDSLALYRSAGGRSGSHYSPVSVETTRA